MQTQQIESVIARPNTARKPEASKDDLANYIDPTAPRWIMPVVTDIKGIDSQNFSTEKIEANRFFPLRMMSIATYNATGSRVPRTPKDQLDDILQDAASEQSPKIVLDLFKLSQLENESDQERVLMALANPKACTKYPFQLKNRCVTCWREYLVTDAPKVIAESFANEPRLLEAATATYEQMFNAFENALSRASADIHKAKQALDDKKTGKSQFFDVDYANIRHSHQDMPQFRTQTDGAGQMAELIAGLKNILPSQSGISLDDVKSIVSEAMNAKDKEIAELKAQLAVTETAETVKCGDTGGQNGKGEPCGNTGKIDGRCSLHPLEN